ncbi:MAG TPA: enoyl-CoA hydratase/isomerase family protein [Syntrophales bacterium]|nr:enoyl-CoA hydratase/isomerase family protein [Syntrophales bacterium]
MSFVQCTIQGETAVLRLSRGKVNSLTGEVVRELKNAMNGLIENEKVKAVILTGQGKFFSYGFDIPEFLKYSRIRFQEYLTLFTDFYLYVYLYPKPVIAALNGHTIAGGCMIAICCDFRIMVSGKARIALNEIQFGSSVFAGSVEVLRALIGQRNAETFLYSGEMYPAEGAHSLGLIDKVSTDADLEKDMHAAAAAFAAKDGAAYAGIKGLLRKTVAEEMRRRERESIADFLDIWYSEKTWARLQEKTTA